MNRRDFFKGLGALIGGVAIEQAIPFGRVWSFPSKIVCLNQVSPDPLFDNISAVTIEQLYKDVVFDSFFQENRILKLIRDGELRETFAETVSLNG